MMNEKIYEADYVLRSIRVPYSSVEDRKRAEEAIKVLEEEIKARQYFMSHGDDIGMFIDPEEIKARQYFMSHGDDIETLRRMFIDPEEIEARQYFASHGDDIETLKKLLS